MIAVTGANGLVGNFIVRELLKSDRPFVAIRRKESSTELLGDIEANIEWRFADVSDTVALSDAFEGVDCVIHAAGLVSFNPGDKKRLFVVNTEGTRNAVNAALTNGVKKFVQVSSVGALGRPRGVATVNENQRWAESVLNTPYAESKYFAELEVARGQEEGLITSIINPSVVLAPGSNRSSAMLFHRMWKGNAFYSEGVMNYVDVRDVAAIVTRLAEATCGGERYIANAGAVSYYEILRQIATHFGRRPPHIKLNRTWLRLISAVEGVRSAITGSEPLITRETARLAKSQVFFDNAKVIKKFNFRFQPLEDTLKWCCEHYIRQLADKKR